MANSEQIARLVDELLGEGYERIKAAQTELAQIGTAALPALIHALPRSPDDMWLGQALAKIGEDALRGLLTVAEHDPLRRHAAIRAIWEFESAAAPAIPLLSRFLNDVDATTRQRSAHALGRMGAVAISVVDKLVELCHDPDGEVRRSTAYALDSIGLEPSRAIAVYVELSSDKDASVRRIVLSNLKNHAFELSEYVPRLLPLLTDSEEEVRNGAISLIGEIGPAAADALPELARSLHEPKFELQAARSVWTVARRIDLVLPVILRNLEKHPEETCDLITHVGPAAIGALPILLTVLTGKDYDTLWAATNAVEALGKEADAAIPALTRLFSHESGLIAGGAAGALAAIGPDSLDPLIAILKQGTPHEREYAADALGRLGPIAEKALPHLGRLLEGDGLVEDPTWVMMAMAEIMSELDLVDFIDALVDFMQNHPNSFLRFRAAKLLGRLGPKGQSALPALTAALQDDDERVREASKESIRRIKDVAL